jgi:hypothetical protein
VRSYHVDTVALALGRSHRWVDNVVTHHPIPGIASGGRGVTRSISAEGAAWLAAVAALAEAGISISAAVSLVSRAARGDGTVPIAAFATLRIAFDQLRQITDAALVSAAETSVLPRRGRPPARRPRRRIGASALVSSEGGGDG